MTLLLSLQAGLAHAWPQETDWIPAYMGGAPFQDVTGDAVNSRNFVGNLDPSVYLYNDGSFLYYRFRLDQSPQKSATSLDPFGWGLLIDTDGNPDNYEFMLMLDGINNPDQFYLAQNTVPGALGDPSDKAEVIIWQQAASNDPATGNYRVTTVTTGNNIAYNGDPDAFLDIRIDYSVFKSALGLTDNSLIKYFWGTSNSAQSITVDMSGTDLYTGLSDFVTPLGTLPTTGSIRFVDAVGGTVDATQFHVGGNLYVSVTDADQNSQASVVQTLTATLTAPSGDSETILLTETGANTGIFSAAIPTSGAAISVGDGTLQVQPIEFVTATYTDANDANFNQNQVRTDTIEALPVADLGLTHTVDIGTPNEGDTITYTLTLTNLGPSDSLSTQISDLLPTGVTYVGHTASSGSYNPSTGVWTVGALVSGGAVTLTVQATVNTGTAQQVITNTATITSTGQPDPNVANDSASAGISVQGADLVVTQSASTVSPVSGASVTFTITVTNNGAYPATGISLGDVLPAGLSYTSHTASGTTTYTSGTGVWSVGSLAVGASATLTLTATVTAANGSTVVNTAAVTAADQGDPSAANNTASVSLLVGAADLAVSNIASTTTPAEGSTLTLTVVATNNGPNPATAVVVSDTLPAGLTYSATTTATQGTYDSVTGQWSVGALASGASATLTLQATVNAGTAATTMSTTASVSGAELDSVSGNNSATASVTVAYVDLALVKTVDNPTPTNGSTLTFTLTVTNSGIVPATGVVVTDYLPPYLTTITATAGSPSVGTFDPATGSWALGTLANGGTATLSFTGVVTLAKNDPASFYNSAAITASNEPDPYTGNDADSVAIKVNGLDLGLTKAVDNASPAEGGVIAYTLTLTNNGPNAATNIIVTDNLPTGTTFVSSLPSVGAYTTNNGNWSIASLAVGASATLVLNATVNVGTAGQTITNTGKISAVDQADTNAVNDIASAAIVVGATDVGVALAIDNTTPTEGDTVVLTVTATNNGPNAASGVSITDLLPAGMTYVSDTGAGTYVSGTGVWTVGAIALGASATLSITATIDAGTAGSTLTDTATITATATPDAVPANDSASLSIVVQRTDLGIAVNVDNTTPYEGDPVVYSLTATNLGPHPATGVSVTDLLPTGVTYVSFAGTGTYDSVTGVWSIGALAKGVSVSITITATVATATAGTTITNTATISGTQADTTTGNNTASVGITPVLLTIDLGLTKAVDNATPDEGTAVTYTLTLTNHHGTKGESGIQVTDLLPVGVTYQSHTAGQGTYTPATGLWDVGTLAAGASVQLQIVATVDFGSWTGQTVTNQGDITAAAHGDPTPGNNTAQVVITPVDIPLPSLTMNLTADKTTANPGDIITYTLSVSNVGNGAAQQVLVSNTFSPHADWSQDAYGANTPFTFTDGVPASGISLGIPEYSNDGGTTWTYLPTGFDPNVTHWRILMGGAMAAGRQFTLQFQGRVQ